MKWRLSLCLLQQEYLRFRSLPAHLMASLFDRWCLKLKSPQSLFGMFVQGKKLPLTFIPTVKTLGLFFLVLPVTTKEAVWLPSSRPEKLP